MSAADIVTQAIWRRQQQQEINLDDCTFELCSLKDSYYGYQPSLAANVALVAIFGVSLAAFLVEGVMSRRFIGFSISMIVGVIGEIIGYVGRIMMHNNPWKQVSY